MGRHVPRIFLQRGCSRIARLLRRDREVLRQTSGPRLTANGPPCSEGDIVHRLHRREFLALSGGLLLAGATLGNLHAAAKLSIPPPPRALPKTWLDAPTLPVWTGNPPDFASFAPQPRQADWSPVFLSNVSKPDLRVFRPAQPNGRAVLVIPGGAYWFVSAANEGADLAERLTKLGITVFVLTYRLPGEGWKNRSSVPLQDAQRAMRVIRANATRFEIDADKVSVLGFSAGGHLAATLATQHGERSYSTRRRHRRSQRASVRREPHLPRRHDGDSVDPRDVAQAAALGDARVRRTSNVARPSDMSTQIRRQRFWYTHSMMEPCRSRTACGS